MAGLVMMHLSMGMDADICTVKGEEVNIMTEMNADISVIDIETVDMEPLSEYEQVSGQEYLLEEQEIKASGEAGVNTEPELNSKVEMNQDEVFNQNSELNQEPEPNEEIGYNGTVEFSSEEIVGDFSEYQPGLSEVPVISPIPLITDFRMSATEDIPIVKAGQQVGYEILLENTGDVNLEFVELRSILDNGNLEGEWLETEGLSVDDESGTATLSLLEAGEERTIVLMVSIPEERQNNFNAEFFAKVENPLIRKNNIYAEIEDSSTQEEATGKLQQTEISENISQEETSERLPSEEYLSRFVSLTTEIIPLKIEYTVKKWADRARAVPGDTITYQICIRNTGERSLHSVFTTEKFQTAGLKAQFQEQEGVILNGAKTEALIAEIKPGEAYGLYATVTLPVDFEGSDLLNEVTVVTRETGETTLSAQATVEVEKSLAKEVSGEKIDIVQPISTNYDTGKVIPQTSDMSEAELWSGAFGISCILIIGIYWIRKAKRKR